MRRLLCLLLVLAGAALVGSRADAASQLDLLVVADRLFDGERVIRGGAVAIDGGRVVAVGPGARLLGGARRVRRFSDATIVPGLVDLHVHLLGSGEEASAVTTVRDLAAPVGALPVRQRARAPRVLAAGPFVTAPGGYPGPVHGDSLAYPVRGAADARKAVRELVGRGAHVIKVGVTVRYPNLSAAELAAVVDEAHALGRRVTAHVEDIAGTRTALAAGIDELAHMPCVGTDPELMRTLARRGVEIVGTLYVVSLHCRGGTSTANARAFVGAGGTLLYGSDFGNPGIPLGVVVEELRLMRAAGLSSLDVLRNATSRSGAVLGLPGVGRLVRGGPADLAVLQGDPTRDLSRLGGTPLLVVVRGALVVDGPRLNLPAP
jgi:imidazolonepropionase-like amidohydrolase